MVANNPNDRVAPNSTEAEEAVLGSILINPEVMNTVSGFLTADAFFLVSHSWVFEAMLALSSRSDAIDYVTVVDELRRNGRLETIGGSAFLTRLTNNTPTHVHAETYARLVEHAAIRRKGLKAVGDMAQLFLEENRPLPDIIQKAHDLLTEATKLKAGGDWKFISEFASEIYDKVEQRFNGSGEPLGIPTGLTDLDAVLHSSGWADGEVILVAGRPGMGKSALAMGCAVAAARHKKHVAVLSKEMTGQELTFRALAAESGINTEKMKAGSLDGQEWGRFTETIGRTSELSLIFDDGVGLDISQLITNCKRLHREWGIDLLFVDYIQLLDTGERRGQNRNNEVDVIGRSLKELALELNIPVVALSQLSRKVEEKANKRPDMSHLRDSGTLEQVADLIILMYRDDYYNEDSEHPGQVELDIAKQRHGRAGGPPVVVGWIDNVTKFVDVQKKSINLEGF